MRYILGLDCGIKSVGAAAIRLDKEEEPIAIEQVAVHLFDGGEHPKDGSSLALPRRLSRSQRRLIKRKARRLRLLKELIARHGIHVDFEKKSYLDICPWEARHKGIYEKLSQQEFTKAILHIAKRRGFKSNRKGEEPTDTDGKKALTGCKNLEEDFNNSIFETVGDYLYSLEQKRNKPGEYSRTVKRDLLQQEVVLLCERQQQFGNKSVSPEFTSSFLEVAFYQRPLASSEHLVGFCTLEKQEKRAPKKSYSAELFLVHSDLINVRILNRNSGVEKKLTSEQIALLVDQAHIKQKVTYSNARKSLGLDSEEYFKSKRLQYRAPKGKEDTDWEGLTKLCEKDTFLAMDGYHTMRKQVEKIDKKIWKVLSKRADILDEVARVLSFYMDEAEIFSMLKKLDLIPEIINSLSEITSFSKTLNLSIKAIHKLMPFMKNGNSYAESVKKAGYQFTVKSQSKKLLPPLRIDELTNPVVKRTLTQARKVINAFILRYGSPSYIHIELARDLAKSREDRNKIIRRQRDNELEKKIALEYAQQFFEKNPSGEDRKKLRLWNQQKQRCVYSGKPIKPEDLMDRTKTQVDHILPKSRSFDNSYHNQVLCLSKFNQDKGNKTPFEAWGNLPLWKVIQSMASELPTPKAQRILIENFDARSQDWKERHLNDTRYACSYLKNHIEENLNLVGRKAKKVRTFNGALTSYTRHLWGFPKNRDLDDTHHGLDAVIVACLSDKVVQKVHSWSRYHSNTSTGPSITVPWDSFRQDLKKKMTELFISRAPNRKAKGAAHKETINAIRSNENGRVVTQKVSLEKVDLGTLEKMFDKDRNWRLYDLLKSRLEVNGDNPKKAFAEQVFMPTNNPIEKPNRVKSIRVCLKQKQGVSVRGGIAENDRMVRVDVFQSKAGFHLCPVYIDDLAKGRLPNKVVVPLKEPVDLDDSFQFLFSLYKNDLVEMISKKGESFLGYYQGTDVGPGTIKIMHHHSSQSTDRKGVKSMKAIKKFTVNYFGERFEVKGEKRLGLEEHLHQRKSID